MLRRQKHALSQSATPFGCTLVIRPPTGEDRQAHGVHIAPHAVGESLRGNTIVATGPRASEPEICLSEVSERVSEREGFQRF